METEKIAEWLGFKKESSSFEGIDYWLIGNIEPLGYQSESNRTIKTWLDSPMGEIAMIHKILEQKYGNLKIDAFRLEYRVTIRNFSATNNEFWISGHEDLNKALQLVILEMLKKEK